MPRMPRFLGLLKGRGDNCLFELSVCVFACSRTRKKTKKTQKLFVSTQEWIKVRFFYAFLLWCCFWFWLFAFFTFLFCFCCILQSSVCPYTRLCVSLWLIACVLNARSYVSLCSTFHLYFASASTFVFCFWFGLTFFMLFYYCMCRNAQASKSTKTSWLKVQVYTYTKTACTKMKWER